VESLTRVRTILALALGLALGVGALPAAASADTFFPSQWALRQVGAPAAWARSTGAGVLIGIVDTGVDLDHPDLAGKVVASADCTGGPCRAGAGEDRHGHGTLVAGIAAATTDNGLGIAGMAPDARLVVAKAVGDDGEGDVADIDRAIRWVVGQGADIVNLSVGDPNALAVTLLGTPLRPAIEFAWDRGAIPVLASGNQSTGLVDLGSANYGDLDAVVVGATTRDGGVARYSSPLGTAKWGVVAPGGAATGDGDDIVSTYRDGQYALASGTSMATPHVSGALALLLAQGLSPEQAVARLLTTLDRSRACGLGCRGRIDVAAAVAEGPPGTLPSQPPPTTEPSVLPLPVPTTSTTVPPTTTTTPAPPEPAPPVTVVPPGQAVALPVEVPEDSRALPVAVAVAVGTMVWLGLGLEVTRRLRDGAGP